MKLNSKALKQLIVDKIKLDNDCIYSLWDEEYKQELSLHLSKLEKVSTWKRVAKEKDDVIIRVFAPSTGCSELDEQLVCNIETDLTDTKILSISIEG